MDHICRAAILLFLLFLDYLMYLRFDFILLQHNPLALGPALNFKFLHSADSFLKFE